MQIEPCPVDAPSFQQGASSLHPCLGGGRCFPEHIAETCCVGEDRGSLLSTYCMPGHVQSPLRKLSHLFPTADVWAFNTFRETHPLHSPVPLVEAPMVHVTLGNRRCPDAQLMAPGLAESVLLPKCHFLRHKSRHRKSLPIVRKSGAVLVPPTAGVAWAPRTATGLEVRSTTSLPHPESRCGNANSRARSRPSVLGPTFTPSVHPRGPCFLCDPAPHASRPSHAEAPTLCPALRVLLPESSPPSSATLGPPSHFLWVSPS